MKKLLIAVLIFTNIHSFAQYHNDEDTTIPNNIQKILEDIDTFLRVREEQVRLNYPEYNEAFNHFKSEVEKSSAENNKILIKSNEMMSNFNSELTELKRQYNNSPSSALEKLIERKEKIELKKLENDVRNNYKLFLENAISLKQKLRLATKIKFTGFAVPQAVMSLLPIFTPLTITGIIPGLYQFKVVDSFNETLSKHDSKEDDYDIFEATRKIPRAKHARKKYNASKAKSLFGNCKTQGCVYFLAEDYINYINLASKLNKTVKNNLGFELKKVKFFKRKTIEAIDEIAEFAANGLPTGKDL